MPVCRTCLMHSIASSIFCLLASLVRAAVLRHAPNTFRSRRLDVCLESAEADAPTCNPSVPGCTPRFSSVIPCQVTTEPEPEVWMIQTILPTALTGRCSFVLTVMLATVYFHILLSPESDAWLREARLPNQHSDRRPHPQHPRTALFGTLWHPVRPLGLQARSNLLGGPSDAQSRSRRVRCTPSDRRDIPGVPGNVKPRCNGASKTLA